MCRQQFLPHAGALHFRIGLRRATNLLRGLTDLRGLGGTIFSGLELKVIEPLIQV